MGKYYDNADIIIERLQQFNYRYQQSSNSITIFLPLLCYLEINFKNGKMKMTSHTLFGLRFLSLEYNFVAYALLLYILTWFAWAALNKAVFVLLGLLLVQLVICVIKTESLRTIIHQWVDNEMQANELKLTASKDREVV